MNRVLFNNCGLTGNKFATILEGLALVKDFKSIIYKHNELNALAISKLQTHQFVEDFNRAGLSTNFHLLLFLDMLCIFKPQFIKVIG